MKKTKILSLIFSCMLLSVLISGCSGGYEDQLAASWYGEGDDTPAFILYSDGTCEMNNEYGTGSWTVLDDSQLKMTNYYGETETADIVSLEDGCLTLGSGDDTVQFWNTPQ